VINQPADADGYVKDDKLVANPMLMNGDRSAVLSMCPPAACLGLPQTSDNSNE
jgi:hypothetical protein